MKEEKNKKEDSSALRTAQMQQFNDLRETLKRAKKD